jgi:hypothetical protein
MAKHLNKSTYTYHQYLHINHNGIMHAYLFYFYLFIEFVTIQKKHIDKDDAYIHDKTIKLHVTGERNRTFVPLET